MTELKLKTATSTNLKSSIQKEPVQKKTKLDKPELQAKTKVLLLPRKQVDLMEQYLATTYPKCFVKRPNKPKPLAIGIHKQLQQLELVKPDSVLNSEKLIKLFLNIYTKSWQYQKSLALKANRYNLDGTIAGQVEQNQTESARNTLARLSTLKEKKLVKNDIVPQRTPSWK